MKFPSPMNSNPGQQFLLVLCLILLSLPLRAQSDSTSNEQPELSITGFVDAYYAYDFNKPDLAVRQPYFFNHNRHNEFNLNMALLRLGVTHSKYRANVALQSGTYAADNYASEAQVFQSVFEANVGVSLSCNDNLWLDAGLFPSHLGFESAISMDNWTLTRSLVAENSPYFLTGAKLTYEPNDQWTITGIITNGWQRIQRVQENSMLSYGTQVTYQPSGRTTINWSTFIGTDDPDSTRRVRYFSNLYAQLQLSDRFGVVAAFDAGSQQRVKGSAVYDGWFGTALIAQYVISDKFKTAVRFENFWDETSIIVPTNTANGFKVNGTSMNLDYIRSENVMIRLEGRWFNSVDNIFVSGKGTSSDNLFIASSVAVKFGR